MFYRSPVPEVPPGLAALKPTPTEPPPPVPPAPIVIVLEAFKKGWAKGSRLKFLQDRLADYKSALQQSKTKGNDFLDTTLTAYFKIYPWDLPMDLEPLPPQLPAPPPVALSPYDQAMKQAVIKRMRKVSL